MTYNPELRTQPPDGNPTPAVDSSTTVHAVPIAYALPIVEEVVVPVQQEILEYPYGRPLRRMEGKVDVSARYKPSF